MRASDLRRFPSHPYRTVLYLDPARASRLQRQSEDDPAVRVVRIEEDDDVWSVHVACACDEIRIRLEDVWS
jgi:hypothetical protein